MQNRHREIEFKYDASAISDQEIDRVMRKLRPKSRLIVKGWDYFFENKDHAVRFRDDKKRPELTIKRRLSKKSMADRIECNLPLGDSSSLETIRAWLSLVGDYKHTFSIFKACRIYFFDHVDIVVYDVFDANKVKVGRFLEIEFLEHISTTVKKAMKEVERYEKILMKEIPIGPAKRLNKSLYELYSPKRNKRRTKRG